MGNNIWTGAMKHQLLVCCNSHVLEMGRFSDIGIYFMCCGSLFWWEQQFWQSLGFAESLLSVWGKVPCSPLSHGKRERKLFTAKRKTPWKQKCECSKLLSAWKITVGWKYVCLLLQQSSLAVRLKAFCLMINSNIVKFFHNAVSF